MHTIPIPEGLQSHAFILGEDVLCEVPQLLRENFPGRRPWIVADGNTWAVAGERLQKMLVDEAMAPCTPHIFPAAPRLHPDYAFSQALAAEMPGDAVPVAVGSGVINDLTKCAAGLREVRYCCVATACSVDGYTSSGGAMSVNGTKKTVKCPAPYAICGDTRILATAPPEMLASGYADLLAKVPAGADWHIADVMGQDPIDPPVWQLIQVPLRRWIASPHDLGQVFNGLVATGYGMQMKNDSRPASGAEHLFSHIWEMEGLQFGGEDVSHGFKVGVGSVLSTLLLEFVRDHGFRELKAMTAPGLARLEREEEISQLLSRGCYGEGIPETAMRKFLEGEALAQRRAEIEANWETMRSRIREQLIPSDDLAKMLRAAGCPAAPQEIGLGKEQCLHAILAAQLMRIRYTVIDLLYELGLLRMVAGMAVEKVFSMAR